MSEQQPTAEEQAALAERMKAKRPDVDPAVAAEYQSRMDELEATLTEERRKRDDAERARDAAEARELASRPQNTARGRNLPITYTLRDEHVSPDGDIDKLARVVEDVNKACAKIEGFQSLTLGDFLALNSETLDNEAKARGFAGGARYALRLDDGSVVSGYHLFTGTQFVVGTRK